MVEAVALFKGHGDVGMKGGEAGIGDGSWVVNDLWM